MARIVKVNRAGEPSPRQLQQNFRVFRRPMQSLRSVRTLIKRDESKGVTMPEARGMAVIANDIHGVSTPDGGGYRGAQTVNQRPLTPPASGSGETRISPPNQLKGGLGRRVRED